jgi:hypothetical protein
VCARANGLANILRSELSRNIASGVEVLVLVLDEYLIEGDLNDSTILQTLQYLHRPCGMSVENMLLQKRTREKPPLEENILNMIIRDVMLSHLAVFIL